MPSRASRYPLEVSEWEGRLTHKMYRSEMPTLAKYARVGHLHVVTLTKTKVRATRPVDDFLSGFELRQVGSSFASAKSGHSMLSFSKCVTSIAAPPPARALQILDGREKT